MKTGPFFIQCVRHANTVLTTFEHSITVVIVSNNVDIDLIDVIGLECR